MVGVLCYLIYYMVVYDRYGATFILKHSSLPWPQLYDLARVNQFEDAYGREFIHIKPWVLNHFMSLLTSISMCVLCNVPFLVMTPGGVTK
jgi:hypothetical protein